MREIYFDNAATTKPSKAVIDNFLCSAEKNYANPSSMHDFGLEAELGIKNTSKIIATILNCDYEEIVYTSGGTESNNLAIFGATGISNKKHIITTTVEHPSVMECFKKLESEGFEVTYLCVDNNGKIDLSELKSKITEKTSLVSILHINNETGAIQDIAEIGKIIKEKNRKTLFHVDGVQSFGKYDINVKKNNIDLLSISSHKIHGLKGIGALYIKNPLSIKPLFYGGGQQKNIRPGTENSFGIMAFGIAAKQAYDYMDSNLKRITEIKNYIINNLSDDVIINSPEYSSPYILNISLIGAKAEVLLHALSAENIFVSAGSACSSKAKNHSILGAYGKGDDIINSSIRLSFSGTNTIEEAEKFVRVFDGVKVRLLRMKR